VSGTPHFSTQCHRRVFHHPAVAHPNRASSFSTVNLALSQPTGGATLGSISSSSLIIINQSGSNASTDIVTNTGDSGPGSLRQAIIDANASLKPGTVNIVFDIPASTSPNFNVPVAGFDPTTQTWQITLNSPLPPITHSVAIDGYSQANIPVPFRYPGQISSAVQEVAVGGFATGEASP